MTRGVAISITLPTAMGGSPVFCDSAFWIVPIWLPNSVLTIPEPPAAAMMAEHLFGVYLDLVLGMATLVLARVVDPVTAQQVVGIITGRGV